MVQGTGSRPTGVWTSATRTWHRLFSELVGPGEGNGGRVAALQQFRQGVGSWRVGRASATPALLLGKLNEGADLTIKTSPGWPRNPIALSKRLLPLQAALLSQGLKVELHRGKHRTITLTRSEAHIKAAADAHAQQDADNHVY